MLHFPPFNLRDTALQWYMELTSEETGGPACFQGTHPSPWKQAWIPQCISPTTGKGKDTAQESTTCPSSSHKKPSLQLSYLIKLLLAPWFHTSSLRAEPARRMGNASLGTPGEPSSPAAAAACPEPSHSDCRVLTHRLFPTAPSAGDKLLLSPGVLPDLPGKAAGPLLCTGMGLHWKLYKGWVQ